MEDLSWIPPEVDTQQASIARVYDYWLGGKHNFLADRDAARAFLAVAPNARAIAQANRAFLGRAVRFLAGSGVRQFLDIGSGIPTEGNVHEIAQGASPGARVIYADIDPVAVAHSRAILDGNPDAEVIHADLCDPEKILAHPQVQRLIDFGEPVGLLLVAVLHFLSDTAEPWHIVATLGDALPPGSYLVISHATSEGMSSEAVTALQRAYQGRVNSRGALRSRAAIEQFFDGFELVEPGVVFVPHWRPFAPQEVPSADAQRFWWLVGVGRKPGQAGPLAAAGREP